MRVREMARRAGVSVRTLHYYDQIGLLKPDSVTQAGYREYGEDALQALRDVLFLRELDLPLSEITAILRDPAFDRAAALRAHKRVLERKRERLERLITLVDTIIEGEDTMAFDAFDQQEVNDAREQYRQEVKARWGDTQAFAQSEAKTAAYTPADWEMAQGEGGEILQAFAGLRAGDPAGADAQALVRRWQAYITRRYYECTAPILACLGQMYVDDPRFTRHIDGYGAGTAAFMAAAIAAYCGESA